MDKTYQPHAIETSWYKTWEEENYFAPQGAGDPYTIMIPPPNVTGSLHMGHGFNNAIMDALIRFRRMKVATPCGNRAPTTPVSPPKCWLSVSVGFTIPQTNIPWGPAFLGPIAEYGWLHCGPPTTIRKLLGSVSGAGRMEWPINSKPG